MSRLYDIIITNADSNTHCLISGSVSGSMILPLDSMIVHNLFYFLDEHFEDLYVITGSAQKEVFIKTVKKYCKLNESMIYSYIY